MTMGARSRRTILGELNIDAMVNILNLDSSDMVKPGSPRYDAARQLAEVVVSIKLLLSRLNLRQKSNGDMVSDHN